MRSDDPANVSVHARTIESDNREGIAAINGFPSSFPKSARFPRDAINFGALGHFPRDSEGAEVIDYSTYPLPREHLLPTDNDGRKAIPVCTGVLDYFPAALIEIAKVSKAGNDQHNPGQDLHWARGKSMNQADTMLRHWMERGSIDTDGVRHTAKAAWRALAELQLELEAAGYPVARGAK